MIIYITLIVLSEHLNLSLFSYYLTYKFCQIGRNIVLSSKVKNNYATKANMLWRFDMASLYGLINCISYRLLFCFDLTQKSVLK